LSSAVSAEPTKNKDPLLERLKVIGTITQNVNGRSVGIVVLKDTKTNVTQAIEVGKAFTIESKLFRVVTQRGKSVVISDGAAISALAYGDGLPSNQESLWAGAEAQVAGVGAVSVIAQGGTGAVVEQNSREN
jgi:hypothetical protein